MTPIARGTKKVSEIQKALGGTPPKDGLARVREALSQRMAERFAAQKRASEESEKVMNPLHSALLGQLAKNDPKLKKYQEDLRAVLERRSKQKIKPPKREKLESSLSVGSIYVFNAPPYDFSQSWPNGNGNAEASADKTSGTYQLQIQSLGDGWHSVAAGVGQWFYAPVSTPTDYVCWALMDYSSLWWDSAMGVVARTRLETNLLVWGNSEQSWIQPNGPSFPGPNWDDSAGWFEDHGNVPDSGRILAQTTFPGKPNSWYHGIIWSQAWVYGTELDLLLVSFFSAASAQVSVSVPLMGFRTAELG
jgi:hypothetical protein